MHDYVYQVLDGRPLCNALSQLACVFMSLMPTKLQPDSLNTVSFSADIHVHVAAPAAAAAAAAAAGVVVVVGGGGGVVVVVLVVVFFLLLLLFCHSCGSYSTILLVTGIQSCMLKLSFAFLD